VLVRAIRLGELDRLIFPEASLDVLAQQIVACCAASGSAATANKSGDQSELDASDGWDEEELFALVKRAYPYRNLARETFDAVVAMLSEGIASQRGRYGAYLHHDRINRKLRARRGARLAAITGGGTIPDTRCSRWWRNRKALSWARWMKISPPKAWREKSCCWGIRRGASGESNTGRDVCWWRMRMGRRPAFRSG